MAIINQKLLADNPGLEAALLTDHRIVNDIRARFLQWGKLSERQIALVLKIAQDAAKPKEALPPSEWVGTVGVREHFTVRLVKALRFESSYTGETYYVHLFSDELGNDYKWTTGKRFCTVNGGEVLEGDVYRVKATVKKHTEYKGRKQTVVNRVSL